MYLNLRTQLIFVSKLNTAEEKIKNCKIEENYLQCNMKKVVKKWKSRVIAHRVSML